MAEAVFLHKVRQRGLAELFKVDSAGTGDWHAGQLPDARTIRVLNGHGIGPASRARQMTSFDFETFDVIVAMDEQNALDLSRWIGSKSEKIRLMMSFDPQATRKSVPDPYYGEIADFEEVYRLVDSACDGLIAYCLDLTGYDL